jgi:hypothetical protein
MKEVHGAEYHAHANSIVYAHEIHVHGPVHGYAKIQ